MLADARNMHATIQTAYVETHSIKKRDLETHCINLKHVCCFKCTVSAVGYRSDGVKLNGCDCITVYNIT